MTQSGYYSYPTISDEDVVFVCEDDPWSIAATGGVALRVTANPGHHPAGR